MTMWHLACRYLFFVCILSAAGAFRGAALSFNDDTPPQELAPALVNAMTDEEALAQVFMFGWKEWMRGPEPNITGWIQTRALGGVKVFGRNTGDTERLAATIGEFQRLAARGRYNIPLLVATDQEGGMVRHVKGSASDTPGAMAVGASGFPQDAYLSGYYIGKELAVLGINMNFAPSVDLYTNHDSTLIGTRSFGDDPARVGLLAIAFAKGLEAAGVIATAKHFPGHGDTPLDSHGVLPKIDASFEKLWERELVPYRMLARNNIPAIMSGHLAFPNTEARGTPASQSVWFLEEVLRAKIGYKGIIVTDAVDMNGSTMGAGNTSRAAKAALLAGNDIIMTLDTPALDDALWTSLLRDMKADGAFNERVREAARRVLMVKLRYLKGEQAALLIPRLDQVRSALPDAQGATFFRDLAARSVTLVSHSRNFALPLTKPAAGSVLLVGDPPNKDFFDLGKETYTGAKAFWSLKVDALMLSYARAADTIILYLNNEEGIEVLRAFRPLGKRIVVFSTLSPSALAQVPGLDAVLAIYSGSTDSIAAGFSALSGRIEAHGAVPFKLERMPQ